MAHSSEGMTAGSRLPRLLQEGEELARLPSFCLSDQTRFLKGGSEMQKYYGHDVRGASRSQ